MEKVEKIIQDFSHHKYFKYGLAILAILGAIMFIKSSEMGILFNSKNYMLLSTKGLEFSDLFKKFTFPFAQILAYFESLFFGTNPQIYRGFHLLIHGITCLSLTYLLKKFEFKYFYLIGIIFFIHPVHLYSIYIFEAMNALYSVLFASLSVIFYLKQLRTEKTYNPNLLLSLVFYFISIQCHYLAIFLPILYFLFNYEKGNRESFNYQSRLIAFFIFMIIKIINIIKIAPIEFAQNEGHPFTLNFFQLAIMRIAHSYEVLLAPNVISPLYSFSNYNIYTAIHGLIYLALMITHMFLLKGKLSTLAKTIPFFVFPIIGVFYFRYIDIAPFTDDIFYIVYFLTLTFIFGIYEKLFTKRAYLLNPIGVLIILILISYTASFSSTFSSEESFYNYTIQKAPEKYHGYILIAEALEKQGNFEEAQRKLFESEPYWLYFPKFVVRKIQANLTDLEVRINSKEKKKGE